MGEKLWNFLLVTYGAILAVVLPAFSSVLINWWRRRLETKSTSQNRLVERALMRIPIRILGTTTIIIVVFIFAFVFFIWKPWLIRVPIAVGKMQVEAERVIKEARLVPKPQNEYSNKPGGQVVVQAPVAGEKANVNSGVELGISMGKPVVPEIKGKQKNAAIMVLRKRKLNMEVRAELLSNKPEGVIIYQEPKAGTRVDVNYQLIVDISKGRPHVPKVIGKRRTEAENLLQEATLTSKVVEEISDQPEGIVIKVDPKEGTKVSVGEKIELTVSSLPLGQIKEPQNGASEGWITTVKGTARNVSDKSWWLIIQPHGTGVWHPQGGQAITPNSSDGSWKVESYIGLEQGGIDIGRKFDISLALTNSEASDQFLSYIKKAKREEKWNGISLPAGVEKVSQITVVRQF